MKLAIAAGLPALAAIGVGVGFHLHFWPWVIPVCGAQCAIQWCLMNWADE